MGKYENYRWKWDHYPKIHRIDRVPIHLDIEVTTRCNLKCVMCEMSFNPPENQDLPLEDIKRIIDEFTEKGGSSIKFCYIGEPLLYRDLDKVIEYAKKRGVIETIVATNANLLHEDRSVKLINAGLDWIIFSIDSCHEDTYERIRVGGNLLRVKQFVSSFFKIRESMGLKKPRIQIQTIPMELNICEIKSGQYQEFWLPFCDYVRISPFCEDYKTIEKIEETPYFRCPSIFRRMTIRADGKIALCCGTRSEDKILGDIYNNSLEEIWTGKKFKEIRKLMIEGKSHLIEPCSICTMRKHYVGK